MNVVSARGTEYQFQVDRGERFILEARITDTAGTPLNITGHKVELVVEDQKPGGALVLQVTNATHQDAAGGITRFTVPGATTMLASPTAGSRWQFAVHWKDASVPPKEDIHSFGVIVVNPVPVRTIA